MVKGDYYGRMVCCGSKLEIDNEQFLRYQTQPDRLMNTLKKAFPNNSIGVNMYFTV